jgi:uncharacterized protein
MIHSDALNTPIVPRVLLLPGIGNSGPEHWQSLWERANPSFLRVQQRDWDRPERQEWVEAIGLAVSETPSQVIVAHSLACLAFAHWAAQAGQHVKAALLVAVPDPNGHEFPAEAHGFSGVPLEPFGFPSLVVASSNDPYGSLEHSKRCARAWGSRLVNVGALGHINASSGLGGWPEGFALLQELVRG